MHPPPLTWQGFGENHRSYHGLAARAVLIGERPGTAPPHISLSIPTLLTVNMAPQRVSSLLGKFNN